MRAIMLYIFILLMILPPSSVLGSQNDAMAQLADGFQENGLLTSEWNVIIKEKMNKKDAEDLLIKLKRRFDMSESVDENSKRYQAAAKNEATKSDIHYSIILPDNTHYQAEFIVSLNGHNWDEHIEQAYDKEVEKIKKAFFTKHAKTFACLTGVVHGKISSVYLRNKMTEVYHAKIVSKQTDSNDESMIKDIYYGYTPLWKEKINIDGETVNLQFVIKKTKNGALKITIGTPILLNEY